MTLILVGVVAVVTLFVALWIKAARERRDLERHNITLKTSTMLTAKQEVLLFDVRQPLDLLTDAEIIPGASRVRPKEIEANSMVIPKDREVVVYCTCPSDATARRVSHRAQEMHFTKVRFLKGGLGGWKRKGYPVEPYPVEPYTEAFHLDTAT